MRFKTIDVDPNCISIFNELPAEYAKYSRAFAKPLFISTPAVDIIYHERVLQDCAISHNVIIARKPVALQPVIPEEYSSINCMLQGSVKIRSCNNDTFWLLQGQYNVFQISSEVHKAYFPPGIYEMQHLEYNISLLHHHKELTDVLEEWVTAAESQHSSKYNSLAGIIWDQLYEIIKEIGETPIDNLLQEYDTEYRCKHLLLKLVGNLANCSNTDDDVYETIASYMKNNMTRKITLQELCNKYGMGSSKLRQGFLKHFGVTLMEYFNRERMVAAKQMLHEGISNISEIAGAVGYQSVASFSKEFKKHFGIAPSVEKVCHSGQKSVAFRTKNML